MNDNHRHNMTDYDESYRSFQWVVPESYNFAFDDVDRQAVDDKLALVSVAPDGLQTRRHTFGDLRDASNRFAHVLGDLGLAKGDRVLVMVPQVPEWYFAVLGLIKRGIIVIPAPSLLTARDVEYRVNLAEVAAVVTTAPQAAKVDAVAGRCPSLRHKLSIGGHVDGWHSFDDLLAQASPLLDRSEVEPTRSDDRMLIYFTSGTTGEPKMVVHNQSYAIGHTVTARFCHDLTRDDLHWTIADTGWAKTAWGKLFGQWIIGAAVLQWDVEGRFHADQAMEIIARERVTSFCAPPTIYRMAILGDLKAHDLSSLRHCMSAGEPLNPEVIRQWRDATGLHIYDFYGQTETVAIISNFPALPVRIGAMGKPTPGHDIRLLDDELHEVPVGEVGQIAVKTTPVRPPGLLVEYWKADEKNGRVFKGDYYLTGDKATRDADGYFWFVARADDVIKASGYRIGPFEVESALMEHPAVAEAAVVGAADPVRGLVVKAFIRLVPGYTPSDELTRDIQDHVKRTTAPYKYPRLVEYVDEFPKTISGKIQRNKLREREQAR